MELVLLAFPGYRRFYADSQVDAMLDFKLMWDLAHNFDQLALDILRSVG